MAIFDGHVHLSDEKPEEYVEALLRAMDRNGVGRAIVFAVQEDTDAADSLALSAHKRWPDRFTPFTCELDTEDPQMAERLDERLSEGDWRGLGEIFVTTNDPVMTYQMSDGKTGEFRYPVPANGPLDPHFGEVFEVCAKHGVPALVHCDDEEVMETLVSRHPAATIIWGHADWYINSVRRLLGGYPNVICDIGTGLHFAALDHAEKNLVEDWLAVWVPLLEEFAGRISFGSDLFEWRHLQPDENADCAYTLIERVTSQISVQAKEAWLCGTLQKALGER